ncbi:MAG: bacteriocin-protection protein [Gemmatimonadetes bacterium]|nr:bacteriocin-protection protein [Gemmatimonadota bacterium]
MTSRGRRPAEPTFFATPARFRAWLERHHGSARELTVGFYKVGSGQPSITWPESVDQALCFGWIDGIRRARDEESYTIRFSPRRPTSNWSDINIAKVAELERQGLMRPAGRLAFDQRRPGERAPYSYQHRYRTRLEPGQRRRFRRNTAAWAFFQRQPVSYRQSMVFWITGAKRPETKAARLERLIAACGMERRV